MDESLKRYLSSKYDPSVLSEKDAEKDADAAAALGIMRGAAQIGALGGKVADTSAFEMAVQGAQKARQQRTAGILRGQEIADSRAYRQAQIGKLTAEAEATRGEADPQSQASIVFRNTIKSAMPSIGSIAGFEGMSAKQLKEALPLVKDQFKPKDQQNEWSPTGKTTADGMIVYRDKYGNEKTGITKVASDGTMGMPKDAERELTILSDQNAKKRSIANQMRSYLEQFQGAATEDDKIRIGRQMLKVLNSPEGADAIGVEEARRLGNALEFQVFNVLDPGPMFGRDIEGFDSQVASTIAAVEGGIKMNEQRINELKGGPAAAVAQPRLGNKPAAGTATAAPASLSPEQKQRLEELRAKHRGGQ